MVTVERLRELLAYDPETGVLTWIVNASQVPAGTIAGYVREDGYVEVGVDGHPYRGHRIAWALHHGAWPEGLLDHRNGVRHDNRIENLRPTTRGLNLQNQRRARSNNKSGYLGVSPASRCPLSGVVTAWRATIKANGRFIQLGTFPSPVIAHAVYVKAKRYLHPACTL